MQILFVVYFYFNFSDSFTINIYTVLIYNGAIWVSVQIHISSRAILCIYPIFNRCAAISQFLFLDECL